MTAIILKLLSILMEYGMLLFLLVFVTRLAKAMFRDARAERRSIQQAEEAASGAEASLLVLEAADPALLGRRFAFRQEITIGRGPDNDIVIPENFVSHHHAVVFRHRNLYVIQDLGGVNPSYVNGRPLSGKAYLHNGDQIRVGLVSMKFER